MDEVLADAAEEKVHYSWFLVTINTNYRPKTRADAVAVGQELFNAFRTLLTPEGFQAIIVVKKKGDTYDKVDHIEVPDWATELGKDPRGKRVHLHGNFILGIKYDNQFRDLQCRDHAKIVIYDNFHITIDIYSLHSRIFVVVPSTDFWACKFGQ